MVEDAKNHPERAGLVKAIMLLTIIHLIIYILLLNNEEARNVCLFFLLNSMITND